MNNDLKEKTPFNTKISFLTALVITILACLFVRAVEQKPYTPRVEAAVQMIELPPQLQQLKEPPPPPKAQMPVAARTDAEIEQATIEKTNFDGIEKQPQVKLEEVYDFDKVDVRPVLIKKYCIEPEYPEFAKKANIEGTVMVEGIIDTNGLVIDVEIKQGVHPLLDESSIKAFRKWRFTPAKKRDKPVRVKVIVPFRFFLEEE